MKVIFSIQIWTTILAGLAKVFFLPFVVFLPFGLLNRKSIAAPRLARLILLLLACGLSLRLAFFFTRGLVHNRYLLPLIVIVLILAVPGFYYLCGVIVRFLLKNRFRGIAEFVLVIVLASVCCAKALHYRDAKDYIRDVAADITERMGKNSDVVFLSDLDLRPSYYAGILNAKVLPPKLNGEKLADICKENCGSGGKVFLLLDIAKQQERKLDEKHFKLLKTYPLKKGNVVLYQYPNPVNKTSPQATE